MSTSHSRRTSTSSSPRKYTIKRNNTKLFPTVNVPFDFTSIDKYFATKTQLLEDQYTGSSKTSFAHKSIPISNTIHNLIQHIKSEFTTLPHHSNMRTPWIARQSASWRTTDAWLFRERVLCYCLKFVTAFLKKHTDRHNSSPLSAEIIEIVPGLKRVIPRHFRLTKTAPTFTVLGSAALESDIDITIQGDHAIFMIAILEDVFEMIDKYVPIKSWDVMFYGDFRILSKLFPNIAAFEPWFY
jgi:hypothetical protein